MKNILENWQLIIGIVLCLTFICFVLLKFSSEQEDSELWFPQHLLPERNSNSNYSNDVLIQCYDTRKHLIGYYDFGEEMWKCINYQDIPKNFKWKYLTIEID